MRNGQNTTMSANKLCGIENIRGDSYDDACRYKGKKRKEYELGYEEGYDAGFDDGFADSDCDSEEEE